MHSERPITKAREQGIPSEDIDFFRENVEFKVHKSAAEIQMYSEQMVTVSRLGPDTFIRDYWRVAREFNQWNDFRQSFKTELQISASLCLRSDSNRIEVGFLDKYGEDKFNNRTHISFDFIPIKIRNQSFKRFPIQRADYEDIVDALHDLWIEYDNLGSLNMFHWTVSGTNQIYQESDMKEINHNGRMVIENSGGGKKIITRDVKSNLATIEIVTDNEITKTLQIPTKIDNCLGVVKGTNGTTYYEYPDGYSKEHSGIKEIQRKIVSNELFENPLAPPDPDVDSWVHSDLLEAVGVKIS